MNGLAREISEHPFLCSMPAQHQAILLEGATRQTFARDQVIFHEGEPANRFYLIESGAIAIEAVLPDHGIVVVEVLGPEDVLGWSWLFEPFTVDFQARAIEPATTIAFDAAHLLRLSNEDQEFGYHLMKRMARVAARTLHATHRRLIQTSMEKAHTE